MSKNYWVGDPKDLQHYQPDCATITPPEISDLKWVMFGNYPKNMGEVMLLMVLLLITACFTHVKILLISIPLCVGGL